MKNYKLSSFINSLLIGIILFFTVIIFLGFFKGSKTLKIIIALLFSLGAVGFSFALHRTKNSALIASDYKQKEIQTLLAKLEIMPDNELIALLMQIFGKAEINARAIKNKIITNSAIYFFNFSKQTPREFFCQALKQARGKNVIIFCNKPSSESEDLLRDFSNKIGVINGSALYCLMKKYEVLPPEASYLPKKTHFFSSLFLLIKRNFTKKRALTFTATGFALLLYSKFTFFPKYYLISALCCFLFALCCLVFGKGEQKRANEVLPLEFI